MRSWNLSEIEAPEGTRDPVVLHSDEEGRAVMIRLGPGQQLGEHQVKEHAFVVVLEGRARLGSGDEALDAGPGTLAFFEPNERRVISSPEGARLLLILSPWPGEGHYRGGGGPS
ncbi:MAG: AraC family ligand binding domain-containing protein [Thermoleophilia bacterium]|nr:AraC family ligand binding domain-containing protein [Thermoleophilia bacterium]